jgi:hypothetical protein
MFSPHQSDRQNRDIFCPFYNRKYPSLLAIARALDPEIAKTGTSINHVACGDPFLRPQTLVTHMMSLYGVPVDLSSTDASPGV